MTVAGFTNRWLKRLYKTLALMLVIFAVLLSALRLLMPYGDNLRQSLEDYVNSQYQGEMRIGQLTTAWQKYGPVLIARDVTLFNSQALQVDIKEVDLQIDFWGSLRERKLKTTHFTLIGAQVKLDNSLLDSDSKVHADSPEFEGMADLFLEQVERFSVLESEIYLKDFEGRERVFNVSRLAWLNSGNRHQAIGDVEVTGVTANTVKFMLDVTGSNINITPWLGRLLNIETKQSQTNISFRSWLTLDKGKVTRWQVDLGDNQLSWQEQGQQRLLTLDGGQLLWQRTDSNDNSNFLTGDVDGVVNSSGLVLRLDSLLANPIAFELSHQNSGIQGYFSALDLRLIAPLYPLIADDKDIEQQLEKLSLQGKLEDIYLQESPQGEVSVSARLDDISLAGDGAVPGVSEVFGQLWATENKLALELGSKARVDEVLSLDFHQHFARPIPYQRLAAKLTAQWSADGWQLAVPKLSLYSPELDLNGELLIESNSGEAAYMGLTAGLTAPDATVAANYFPLALMSTELVDYLKAGIVAGKVREAKVIFNGPLVSFPFYEPQGIFSVDADIEQAEFRFDSQWPAIKNMAANLNFTNDSMLITVNEGRLANIDASGTQARIDSLSGEAILDVTANTTVNVADVRELMKNSPLAGSVGTALEQVEVTGLVAGDFQLLLPFADLDSTLAQGSVTFGDNQVVILPLEMQLDGVDGSLYYQNDLLTYEGITAQWQGLPLQIKGQSQSQKDYYQSSIDLSANWSESLWQQKIPESLITYAGGDLEWQAQLNLYFPENQEFSYDLQLNSSLAGANFRLPQPYAKEEGKEQTLNISAKGQQNSSTIEAALGEQLNFFGELEHQQISFSRAHLILGKEKMLLPMDGFHITAALDEVEYQPWHSFIFDLLSSLPEGGAAQAPLLEVPERIRGNINRLNFYGQQLNEVSFNLLNQPQWWLLQLNADKARSQIKIHHDFAQAGLEVKADFIHLSNKESEQQEPQEQNESIDSKLLFKELIPVKFSCESCKYGMIDFGHLNFEFARSDNNQIELKYFDGRRGQSHLDVGGSWVYDSVQNTTRIRGRFATKDFEYELKSAGFDSIIRDSGLELTFDLSWPGGPHEFDKLSMAGKVKLDLDDGYLADVDDKGARLLSIFSLKSLVRKLTLDFRDIFSNGMFYENIRGEFVVENGVIYTDNVRMKGAAGDLTVQGNTRLADGQLDYRMSFIPKVTSSIPVIVAWMVNPVVGLATLAVDEVIQSAEVISKINFELTGTVDEPNFKEVKRHSRDIAVSTGKDVASREEKPQDNPDKAQPLKKEPQHLQPEEDKPQIDNNDDHSKGISHG
jgi:uncharacterized protein (TIGR02099 family)